MQPPKRRAAIAKTKLTAKRPSKLAKEHGLTADQEAEMREAFGLFAVRHPDHEEEKEGVLRRDDVRRCLMCASCAHDVANRGRLAETIIQIVESYAREVGYSRDIVDNRSPEYWIRVLCTVPLIRCDSAPLKGRRV